MRGIRVVFELGAVAVNNDWRYSVKLGDGHPGPGICLANPNNAYSQGQWPSLLGTPVTRAEWTTNSTEGMYVNIARQVPNPDFDFSPEQYQRQAWLKALYDVDSFRVYNPWIGRPFLSWSVANRWTNNYTFSEGDTGYFNYSINDYEFNTYESGQYRVHRLDDSDNYKEFIIVIGV